MGWGENPINWITEIQAGTFQVGTQLDSIGHIQIGERFYNGWTTRAGGRSGASTASAWRRCRRW